MKKQSFATGVALLAVAIGFGKIFSAVFKIPLDRIFLHAEGMAIFNSAYNIYMLFFSVATAGIPMAISSLIASSGSKEEENTILSTSLISVESFLFIISLLIFVFSDFCASLTGIPTSALSFKIMSVALLFCGLTACFRGYFQGKRSMTYPAISQLLDSLGRLFLGFLLVFILWQKPLHIASGGAMAGVPFGALMSAVFLLIAFLKTKEKLHFSFSAKVLKNILFLAMPITLTSSLHPLFNMADTLSVVPILSLFTENAQAAFGHLSRAATLYALPVSIASAVSSSILPAVSENLKNGNYNKLNYESSLAIRLAVVISAPCACGFMAISSGILELLYDNTVNHTVLIFMAPSAVFASVGCVLACILQGLGKTKYSVFSAAFACIGKIVLNPVLMGVMGVNGAALATSISYFVFMATLIIYTLRFTPIRFSINELALKPAMCGFLCFISAFFAQKFFDTPVSIIIAAVIYIPSVFIINFFRPEEIKQIFSGE